MTGVSWTGRRGDRGLMDKQQGPTKTGGWGKQGRRLLSASVCEF